MSRRTPHSTLTEVAARAARALRAAGLLPYPGVINPKRTRNAPRAVVTAEPGRVKVAVAGHGHQEILLYGPVERDDVVRPLERVFGPGNVTVRDPHGIWSPEPELPTPSF